jgi:hypothetical protein
MEHRISTVKTLRYVARNFQTGLTDVTLEVRKPDGTLFDFGGSVTTLILTELTNGEYEGVYTPATLGLWQEKITSTANGDYAIRSYEVVTNDIDTLETHLDTIETKVDSIAAAVYPGGYFSN